MAEAYQDSRARGAGFILPHQGLASLHKGEGPRGRYAQGLKHARREHFADPALQRQPAVATSRPRREARPLGRKVEEPAGPGLPQLGEGEAPAIANLWIVNAELVAVISLGKGSGQVVRKGSEATEMVRPLRVGQPGKAHGGGGAVVPPSEPETREVSRPDRIGEIGSEDREAGIRTVVRGQRHAPEMTATAADRKT